MTCALLERSFTLVKGATYIRVARLSYSDEFVYKPVTGITKTAPVRLTVPSHGVPDGWLVAVASVVGMRQINAKNSPPRSSEFHAATVIDANTLDINAINALGFSSYVSGGVVQYYRPVDLAGFSSSFIVRETADVASTVLLSVNTTSGEVIIDNATKTITIMLSEAVVRALTWDNGYLDWTLTAPGGVVTFLAQGELVTVVD